MATFTMAGVVLACSHDSFTPETANITPQKDANTINADLNQIAQGLAVALKNGEMQQLIRREAMKKFDGDFDILYSQVKTSRVGSNAVQEVLAQSTLNRNSRMSAVEALEALNAKTASLPLLNISVPVNIDKWQAGNEEVLVAVSPSSWVQNEKALATITAYDSKGNIHLLDAKIAPDFPVVVIGLNERVEVSKSGQVTLKKLYYSKTQSKSGRTEDNDTSLENPGGGGNGNSGGCSSASSCGGGNAGCSYPNGPDIYLQWIYCQDGNAWEGWFDGGPEFYFQVAKYDELWTNQDTKIKYLAGVNMPFYAPNYTDLQATWGKSFTNTYLFRWQTSYGARLNFVWYEEDTGVQSDQIIRNAAGIPQVLSVTWNGQNYSTNALAFIRYNDDFVAAHETYIDHCSGFIYGSNTFKYKITKQ